MKRAEVRVRSPLHWRPASGYNGRVATHGNVPGGPRKIETRIYFRICTRIYALLVMIRRLLPFGAFCLPLTGAAAQNHPPATGAQPLADAPEVRIESFAPARAYAVGTETLTLVATVRNVGKAGLPANTRSGRLVCVAGLDYFEGDTLPKLPEIAPNQAITYRWKVQPTGDDGALVAMFALETPGSAPDARVIAIQHFPEAPPGNGASVTKLPTARAGSDSAVIENTKLRARIRFSSANVPALFLSSHMPGGWRQAGVCLPLAEALSGEGGQTPWWEVFRVEEMRAVESKTEASLILTGGFGLRWRATFTFTLRADSSVLDARLLLSPLRPLKLSGLRFCPLLAGDGSFGGAASETLPPEAVGPNTVGAVRWGELTVGTVWPNAPMLPGWQAAPLPNVEGADYRLLGVEMRTGDTPVALMQAGMVEARGRLFALAPSRSVYEARRIMMPPKAKGD
jgi:hypothetical protein